MLNINLMKSFDMLTIRYHNTLVLSEDSYIVADDSNSCYVIVEYIEDNNLNIKFYKIELVRNITGKTVATAYEQEYFPIVRTVEKMLKYSELFLECNNTLIKENYKLNISTIGDKEDVTLSLLKNPGDINVDVIKVLSITLNDGVYKTGFCKSDYAEYELESDLIQNFLEGVIW